MFCTPKRKAYKFKKQIKFVKQKNNIDSIITKISTTKQET